MELWIRSQDGNRLARSMDLRIYYAKQEDLWVIEDCDDIAYYKTEERALQVLDEIQNQIKGRYLMKQTSDALFDNKTIQGAKTYFENQNEISLIAGDSNFEIVPIGNDVVVYQMPKE